MNELKCSNWFERIELNEWNDWIEINELTSMKLTWMNWNECIEANDMTWWHEWIGMDDLKGMNCQKWSEPVTSLRFLCETELSLQSRAHFVGLIFKKWSEPVTFLRLFCEIKLSLQCVHILRPLSDRGAKPRKQRPSCGDHGQPLYPKKHRVLRPRVFSAVNSHVPDRSHFPTTWWWCDWHDDVVDMMMWLTWWCGWHDDVVDMMIEMMIEMMIWFPWWRHS